MTYDLFISYSRKNKELIKKLCRFLEREGFTYWIDELKLMPSDDYKEQIARAIYESESFLFFWTEESNESPETAKEIGIAQVYNKKIIPFKVGDFFFDFKIVYDLPRLQCIETSENNIKEGFKQLAVKLHDFKRVANQDKVLDKVVGDSHFACFCGKAVTEKMIRQAVKIDQLVYNDVFQGSVEQCIRWWKQNPDIYVMVQDIQKRQIVGYINAMPLENEIYDRLREGSYIDVNTSETEILTYDLPDVYNLYFSSIAIVPEYQKNSSVFKVLYDAFLEHLLGLAEREIYFKEILADAVSSSGEKMCKYAGMRPLKSSEHGSMIYRMSLLPPEVRPTTHLSRKIIARYHEIAQELGDYRDDG